MRLDDVLLKQATTNTRKMHAADAAGNRQYALGLAEGQMVFTSVFAAIPPDNPYWDIEVDDNFLIQLASFREQMELKMARIAGTRL